MVVLPWKSTEWLQLLREKSESSREVNFHNVVKWPYDAHKSLPPHAGASHAGLFFPGGVQGADVGGV